MNLLWLFGFEVSVLLIMASPFMCLECWQRLFASRIGQSWVRNQTEVSVMALFLWSISHIKSISNGQPFVEDSNMCQHILPAALIVIIVRRRLVQLMILAAESKERLRKLEDDEKTRPSVLQNTERTLPRSGLVSSLSSAPSSTLPSTAQNVSPCRNRSCVSDVPCSLSNDIEVSGSALDNQTNPAGEKRAKQSPSAVAVKSCLFGKGNSCCRRCNSCFTQCLTEPTMDTGRKRIDSGYETDMKNKCTEKRSHCTRTPKESCNSAASPTAAVSLGIKEGSLVSSEKADKVSSGQAEKCSVQSEPPSHDTCANECQSIAGQDSSVTKPNDISTNKKGEESSLDLCLSPSLISPGSLLLSLQPIDSSTAQLSSAVSTGSFVFNAEERNGAPSGHIGIPRRRCVHVSEEDREKVKSALPISCYLDIHGQPDNVVLVRYEGVHIDEVKAACENVLKKELTVKYLLGRLKGHLLMDNDPTSGSSQQTSTQLLTTPDQPCAPQQQPSLNLTGSRGRLAPHSEIPVNRVSSQQDIPIRPLKIVVCQKTLQGWSVVCEGEASGPFKVIDRAGSDSFAVTGAAHLLYSYNILEEMSAASRQPAYQKVKLEEYRVSCETPYGTSWEIQRIWNILNARAGMDIFAGSLEGFSVNNLSDINIICMRSLEVPKEKEYACISGFLSKADATLLTGSYTEFNTGDGCALRLHLLEPMDVDLDNRFFSHQHILSFEVMNGFARRGMSGGSVYVKMADGNWYVTAEIIGKSVSQAWNQTKVKFDDKEVLHAVLMDNALKALCSKFCADCVVFEIPKPGNIDSGIGPCAV